MSLPPCQRHPTTSRRSSSKNRISPADQRLCAALLIIPRNIVLRVQVSSECETPDSYVPSSSPESVADMEVSRFPDFPFIKLEPLSPCPSPPLPVLPSARGRGPCAVGCCLAASLWCCLPVLSGDLCVCEASAVKQEVKVEPNPQDHPSCSNTDLVTIAITLNPVAAQVCLSAFAGCDTTPSWRRPIFSFRILEALWQRWPSCCGCPSQGTISSAAPPAQTTDLWLSWRGSACP